jgi:large subunit ribosomal protein L7/L12
MLTTVGSNKIEAIKAVRAVTGLGLKESKDLVDGVAAGAPKPVKGSVSKDEGDFIAKKLAAIGATVEVK